MNNSLLEAAATLVIIEDKITSSLDYGLDITACQEILDEIEELLIDDKEFREAYDQVKAETGMTDIEPDVPLTDEVVEMWAYRAARQKRAQLEADENEANEVAAALLGVQDDAN